MNIITILGCLIFPITIIAYFAFFALLDYISAKLAFVLVAASVATISI